MKTRLILFAAIGLLAFSAIAQELPMPSPNSVLKQQVGLTDVTIKYSRPSMKGRNIFGELVPMDQLWRAGANMCTRISFSNPVTIAETEVAAGTYAILIYPSATQWEFILNSDTTLRGTSGYDTLKDVLRASVNPEPGPMRETMTFNIDKIRDNGAVINLEWAELSLSLPFAVNDEKQALKNIQKAIKALKDGEYRAYMNGAQYMSKIGMNEDALKNIDKAIEIGDYWYAHWIKAQILGEMERYREAIETGNVALEKGAETYAKNGREFTYGESFMPDIDNWIQKESEKK